MSLSLFVILPLREGHRANILHHYCFRPISFIHVSNMCSQPATHPILSQCCLPACRRGASAECEMTPLSAIPQQQQCPQSIVSQHKYTEKQMISLPIELGVWAAGEREEGTCDLIQLAEAWLL